MILHHWEIGPKTIFSMIFQKCIGPDMFLWIRHCVAEVYAPPSAFLVLKVESCKKGPVLLSLDFNLCRKIAGDERFLDIEWFRWCERVVESGTLANVLFPRIYKWESRVGRGRGGRRSQSSVALLCCVPCRVRVPSWPLVLLSRNKLKFWSLSSCRFGHWSGEGTQGVVTRSIWTFTFGRTRNHFKIKREEVNNTT